MIERAQQDSLDITIKEMEGFIRQARVDIIEMSYLAQVGHIPSALSMVDYLSVIFNTLVDPHRDRILLGKPFGAQAYYSIFAGLGWIERAWECYGKSDSAWTYCINWEHPLITFIDDTMGNCLSVACGVALGSDQIVYINASDASFQAGSVWEAIMFAGARNLGNLVLTVDNNHMQVLGRTPDILDVEPLVDRLRSFGWQAVDVPGHELADIFHAVKWASRPSLSPTALVFNTQKGHGVPFMEDNERWHYKALSENNYRSAIEALL